MYRILLVNPWNRFRAKQPAEATFWGFAFEDWTRVYTVLSIYDKKIDRVPILKGPKSKEPAPVLVTSPELEQKATKVGTDADADKMSSLLDSIADTREIYAIPGVDNPNARVHPRDIVTASDMAQERVNNALLSKFPVDEEEIARLNKKKNRRQMPKLTLAQMHQIAVWARRQLDVVSAGDSATLTSKSLDKITGSTSGCAMERSAEAMAEAGWANEAENLTEQGEVAEVEAISRLHALTRAIPEFRPLPPFPDCCAAAGIDIDDFYKTGHLHPSKEISDFNPYPSQVQGEHSILSFPHPHFPYREF
jgi:hypothetical protein